MIKYKRSSGSILLLTVMIMAVLTTATLGGIAVRFDQLGSTDKVSNSAVAKLAADSGLAKLKNQLATSPPTVARVYNLDKDIDEAIAGNNTSNFKPSPLTSFATYEPVKTSLPRCVAVGVISPWVNSGNYLFEAQDQQTARYPNPALIFNYANIVSDTALGTIAENEDVLNDTDKQKTISQLTNLGHFYNPYATSTNQSDPNYWLIKMGGPEDQFLTKKAADGASSYYKDLDFVYLPYLPRFSDTGLFDAARPGTKVDRITGDDFRTRFEDLIKNNNFRVWLDAAINDTLLYQYGLGDLFVSGPSASTNRLTWLQPNLWNDAAEIDLTSPYQSADLNANPAVWTQKAQPLYVPSGVDSGWDVSIVKGAKSFSFFKLNTGSSNTTFTPGATIDALLYGSLEGLRFNQKITLQLYSPKTRQPLLLDPAFRSNDQGKFYNVTISQLGPPTTSNGIESMPISFRLGSGEANTPKLADRSAHDYANASDVDWAAILAGPQFSTKTSATNTRLIDLSGGDGKDVDVIINPLTHCTFPQVIACPAPGDIISLTKAGFSPLWAKVKNSSFFPGGTQLLSVRVDALRKLPKPLRDQASTTFIDTSDSNKTKIAYYGGAITMNDYDGGFASEGDELWLYDPEADTWQFRDASGTRPGKRAGGSLVFDSINNRLVLFGGYFHEGADSSCAQEAQSQCLTNNRVKNRIAKRLTNDVYAYTLSSNSWEKIDYTFDASKKIQAGQAYRLKTTSTLADRSGLEGWQWRVFTNNDALQPLTLRVDGTENIDIQMAISNAGLAKGDEVFLSGVQMDNKRVSAWGKITDTNFPSKKINLVVNGYKDGGSSVILKQLVVQVIARSAAANQCTGGFNAGLNQYYCDLANSDSTGYAVGDAIVLERYDNSSGTDKLTATLSGYISVIENGRVYFVADEKNAAIADFSNFADSKVEGESAVLFPTPRYTAFLGLQPGDNSTAQLFGGGAKNLTVNARFADLWQLKFTAGTGAGSAIWSKKDQPTPTPSTASDNFNLQIAKFPTQAMVFTANVGVPQMVRDKCPDQELECGEEDKIWDNAKTWTLPLKITGAESLAFGRLATGRAVLIERQVHNGIREAFYGWVHPDTFNGQNNGTNLVVTHRADFPGDPGLSGNSNNAKVTIYSNPRTDTYVGRGTWNAAGYFDMTNISDVSQVPTIGMSVALVQTNTDGAGYDSYTFTIFNRTYFPASNSYRFYAHDRPVSSPLPLYATGNQIVADGASARVVSLTDYSTSWAGVGAYEWFNTASDAEPRWRLRMSDFDATVSQRPSSRLGAALATPFGATSDTLYSIGGAAYGRYASLWKENSAGKVGPVGPGNRPSWQMIKASPAAISDLPALSSGSFSAYKVGATTKAIFFGGKQKSDGTLTDYGRFIGSKVLTRPDPSYFTISDGTFTLAGQSTSVSGQPFTNALNDNYLGPASARQSFQLTQNTIGTGQKACAYIGQASNCDVAPLMRHLGLAGRISNDSYSQSNFGGISWGRSAAIINPGTSFIREGANPNLILSGPVRSLDNSNGRWDQDGYYPYRADLSTPYGTLGADFNTDKTLMLAGFAKIVGGGSMLVTPVGVGLGMNRGTNNRWYSYCAKSELTDPSRGDYSCKKEASRYLSILPDSEDLVFLYNSALALSSTDTYKVVGYYGNVRRGYVVVSRSGADLKIQEIVP